MSLPAAQPKNSEQQKSSADAADAAFEPISTRPVNGDVLEGPKLLAKVTSNQSTLSVPPTRPVRPQSPDDNISLLSADDFIELRQTASYSNATAFEPLEQPETWRGRVRASWRKNKGLALVLISTVFGTLMNVTTRLLEMESEDGVGMHPFQILFARMSITFILCMLWMWWTRTPDFPLGARGIRLILVARGMGGFFGVFGLYWSLQYLPLGDATVLTFLAPIMACYVCSKLLHEPFTKTERIGGMISLLGVILIARPTSLFSSSSSDPSTSTPNEMNTRGNVTSSQSSSPTPEATPYQRLAAVGMSMVGVLGATIAYTTIRWIGKRAHPLISVNYFALWCTIVSTIALLFVPSIPFVLPHGMRQWSLLFFIGVSGFVMQFLLTAGLRYEKSSRATNMTYSQMLFALAFDKVIWGKTPGWMSIIGSSLILGSAVVVAVQKQKVQVGEEEEGSKERNGRLVAAQRDEEVGLMADHHGLDEEEGVEMQTQMRAQEVDNGQQR